MSIYNLQKMIHNNNFSKRQIKEIIADLPLLTWSSWYLHSSMDPILLMLLKSIFHLLSNRLNFAFVSSESCFFQTPLNDKIPTGCHYPGRCILRIDQNNNDNVSLPYCKLVALLLLMTKICLYFPASSKNDG